MPIVVRGVLAFANGGTKRIEASEEPSHVVVSEDVVTHVFERYDGFVRSEDVASATPRELGMRWANHEGRGENGMCVDSEDTGMVC